MTAEEYFKKYCNEDLMIGYSSLVKILIEHDKEIRDKIEEMINKLTPYKNKPHHGTCCTCQECANNYDDCTCERVKALTELLTFIKEK